MAAEMEDVSDRCRFEGPMDARPRYEGGPFLCTRSALDDALALIERWGRKFIELNDPRSSALLRIDLVDSLANSGESNTATLLLLALFRIGKDIRHSQSSSDSECNWLVGALLRQAPEDQQEADSAGALATKTLNVRRVLGGKDCDCAGEALTARERTVLQSISMGLSTKRIAATLKIAPETVKSHTKHIFAKLGTRTRAQSVAYAAKLGLIA